MFFSWQCMCANDHDENYFGFKLIQSEDVHAIRKLIIVFLRKKKGYFNDCISSLSVACFRHEWINFFQMWHGYNLILILHQFESNDSNKVTRTKQRQTCCVRHFVKFLSSSVFFYLLLLQVAWIDFIFILLLLLLLLDSYQRKMATL